MSRPPRPIFRVTTTGSPAARQGRLTFAPEKFGDLVKLQQELAAEEDSVSINGAEGDFAQTLIELSALLGHALAVYQDLFSSEAYLGTAQSPRSLVRHARRLAYQPDMGASATGYMALEVGSGLSGTLPEGFSLASVPRGEQKAQDYETLAEVTVDAQWNDLRPVDSVRPANVVFDALGAATVRVSGTGLGLQAGEPVILIAANQWLALTVAALPTEASGETLVAVTGGPASTSFAATGCTLLAKSSLPLHLFGWNAPGSAFSASELQNSGQYTALNPDAAGAAAGNTSAGYRVSGLAGAYDSRDIYLDQEVKKPLTGSFVLLSTSATTAQVCRVQSQATANVTFTKGILIGIPITTFSATGTPTTTTKLQLVENSIAASVTAVRLTTSGGATISRTGLGVQPLSLGGWTIEAPLAANEPNPSAVGDSFDLPADLTGMRPGRALLLATVDETTAQAVTLRKFELQAGGATRIWWTALTPLPTGFQWVLSDVKVIGNVAPVSHGKSVDETLGTSDGITAFQRFDLKKTPVTLLPSAAGVDPALEVRVNDVAWRATADFYDSDSRDRVFRLSTDENQKTSVIFGDGKKGAIPPSGNKNIKAHYRTGLGTAGNAAPGQISRIKKANPLIDGARNLTAVSGGAEPARFEDVRSLAVRYIRTFDRAVSVPDYADLALQFPGVARASSTWSDLYGVLLVAATAEGDPLSSKEALRAFLDQRRDTQMPLVMLDPQPVDLYLTLQVEHDPAYLTENVKRALQDAFFGDSETAAGMFTFPARQFGQPGFLSEVYEAGEGVEGVTFLDVTRFSLQPAPAVFDTLKAAPSQWLRLQPQNLEISIAPEAGQ